MRRFIISAPILFALTHPAFAADAAGRGGTFQAIVNPWLNFAFVLPSAMALLVFALVGLGTTFVFNMVYGMNVRSCVKQGIHPRVLANTMAMCAITSWIVAAFLILPSIGLGYFSLMFSLVIVAVIVSMLIQRVLVLWTALMVMLILFLALSRIFGIL
jgi:hypothetical protein